jgi:hypothetical protein
MSTCVISGREGEKKTVNLHHHALILLLIHFLCCYPFKYNRVDEEDRVGGGKKFDIDVIWQVFVIIF